MHQGHNSPREFIVTQGPLHSTRDDFWRMVWESNSRAIVMLTRCIEKGREKCDHYWPMDTHPVYYGDICVTILNETHYPDWSITEFMLCRVRKHLLFLRNSFYIISCMKIEKKNRIIIVLRLSKITVLRRYIICRTKAIDSLKRDEIILYVHVCRRFLVK